MQDAQPAFRGAVVIVRVLRFLRGHPVGWRLVRGGESHPQPAGHRDQERELVVGLGLPLGEEVQEVDGFLQGQDAAVCLVRLPFLAVGGV